MRKFEHSFVAIRVLSTIGCRIILKKKYNDALN